MKFPKRRQEVATEFGYPMYAEGLRRAIEFLAPLNVPIEITENGVADAEDTLRTEHLRRHLWVLSNAVKDGHDVRSYHHWSLMDNFEWAEGYSMRFGLHRLILKVRNERCGRAVKCTRPSSGVVDGRQIH